MVKGCLIMKLKSTIPERMSRQTNLQIITEFVELDKSTNKNKMVQRRKSELWEIMKKQKMTYPTFKKGLERLINTGQIKAEIIDDINDPILNVISFIPQVLLLGYALSYLDDLFVYLNTKYRQDFFPKAQDDLNFWLSSHLYSPVSWELLKEIISDEDRKKLKEADEVISNLNLKIGSPLIFVIGWNYIPTSHMDERRRMHDEKFPKEKIKRIVDNIINNQKNNS